MLVHAAEQRFRRGLEALSAGRRLEALALFETALELERRHGSGRPQARYLSYYGLCLALEGRRLHDGLEMCRQAIPLEFYNPDLCLNLGRALVAGERRREAHDAFLRGLALAPTHQEILRELRRMGRRRRPPVPFLDRSHPINVLLGRLSAPPKRPPGEGTTSSRHETQGRSSGFEATRGGR